MLPRTPPSIPDCPPSAGARRTKNFDRELASWFQASALHAMQPPPGQTNTAWPDEPASARIPFLIF
ncbi:MAG TPA: hypothetical protein VIF09_17660 [Polyangiaceae bacterium]|jgi:hypothetical protein